MTASSLGCFGNTDMSHSCRLSRFKERSLDRMGLEDEKEFSREVQQVGWWMF